jgi:flagellin-like hook-associated protein FlgL
MSQRALSNATDSVSRALERLATGSRINRASDDPAGLSVASGLEMRSRVYTQGIRNLNDGLSYLGIADSALGELTNVAGRLKELATQGANGTFSRVQRQALQQESDQLIREFNRVIDTTRFNGRSIFDLTTTELRLQAGFGNEGSLAASIGSAFGRRVGTGTFGAAQSTSGGSIASKSAVTLDLNRDGFLDIVTIDDGGASLFINYGSSEGFTGGQSLLATLSATPGALRVGDVNGDGLLDLVAGTQNGFNVLTNNGAGGFSAATVFATGADFYSLDLVDINGDQTLDIVAGSFFGQQVSTYLGGGTGSFTLSQTFAGIGFVRDVKVGDFNGDGASDIAVARHGNSSLAVYRGSGSGSFSFFENRDLGFSPVYLGVGDYNRDGIDDILVDGYSGDGDLRLLLGTTGALGNAQLISAISGGNDPNELAVDDLNGDGYLDVVVSSEYGLISVLLGNGDGSFRKSAEYTVAEGTYGVTLGDLNGDGALDIVSVGGVMHSLVTLLAESVGSYHTGLLNLSSQAGSLDAVSSLEELLRRLAEERGIIGAGQSRVQTALSTLGSERLNLADALSRIRDADIAQESAQLLRATILQQVTTAILAQANQQPSLALQLLGAGGTARER